MRWHRTGGFAKGRFERAVAGLAVLGAAAVVLAACGAGAGGSPDTITLYSGQHPETTQAEVAAFEAETGIRVQVRYGDENALAQQIEQEGAHSPADVIYTENSPALMALEGKGLLARLPGALLSAVPTRYDSPAGDWVGVSARASVIVYNTSRLAPSQLPRSVLDLADPVWKGKLALAPTETDFQPVVTSIAEARGPDAALAWLKAVKANAAGHIEPDNETLVSDVNRGLAAIGVVDHYYWYRLAKEVGRSGLHSGIAYFAAGDPGYVVDVSGAGVLASSHHRAEAEKFVAFLVSAAGQRTLVSSASFEYPLRPGTPDPPGLVPFSSLHPAPVSVADLGDGAVALRLLQQAQLI